MSTLGSLMLALSDPGIQPYNAQELTENRIRGGQITNQTQLLELAELRRSQEEAAAARQFMQQHPELVLGGGMPTSVLGSLGPAGGPPGGPLTQQTTTGGQPPGAPQVVPGGQDLSRFAMQGAPTPVLASLGPQPQAQANPQQRLLELARTNPEAALAVQKQMQGQHDAQLQREEQRLTMGTKVAEYVARVAQSVTDQASLDAARQELARIHPQAAAQLPQVYSKEAMEPFVTKGIAASEMAQWKLNMAKTERTRMETQLLPELFKDVSTAGTPQAPAGTAPTTVSQAPKAGRQTATASPEFESAIDESSRLYPQVSRERIKAIIAAESNFDAKAVSPVGAKGPMQLMDATANDMGVEDPFNVQQNVRGGTRYYAQLLTKYGGDERKALAAYNWGPGNLDKVGGDVSKAPPETQAYVQKVLGGVGGGSGTETAQAPATNPRVAQLDAMIDQGTRKAKQAAVLGYESLATQYNNDVQRLTAERNRLEERATEIPRAVARQTAETQTKQDLERQRQAQPMLPEDRRKLLTGLRSDIRQEPTFKVYQDVRNGYQNVRIGAESNSAQGDLAIINGLAKILDPSSAVMTGEAKNVEEAQGQLQRWFNSPQRFFEGDRLSTDNRPRFLKMAHDLAKEKLTTARTELTAVYEPLAKEGHIAFSQLLPLEDLKPLGPGPNVGKFEKLVAP